MYLLPQTTVPPLKQKGNIPESHKLKSKSTRIPKEKEPEPEVIKLKKVPVKVPEPEKQIITHKAEVTRHQDTELMVHGLHDRDDREIITLGRTEQVFTAEEEALQLSHFEETEMVRVVKKTEKEGWTRTPKPQKEEEPKAPSADKKKITKLPKKDEQEESVKLKPFEKSGKPEEEIQKIKLKKVPTKPKEPEKEVKTHKVEVTRHYDTELTVHELHGREDWEVITLITERVFTADEEASELGYIEEPEKLEAEDEKTRWIRTPKAPKDEEPEMDSSKKKIKKLPKQEEEQEIVILKPFEKPQKPEAAEPPKAKKESEAKSDTEHTPFKKGETPNRDQPTAAIKHKKDEAALDATPDASEDQKEIPQKKKVDQVPKVEELTTTDKLRGKPKLISTPDKDKEQVVLKPFTKHSKDEEKPEKATEEEKKKHVDVKVASRTPRDETPKGLKEQQQKVEKIVTSKKENEKPQEKEGLTVPPKKPTPPGKKEVIPQTEAEKEIPQKQRDALKKGVELKKTPSPRVGKDKVEDEKAFKPIEQLKKVELKKTLSPKPKEPEQVPIEKKLSAEKVKKAPKTVSPKDSIEAVSLKKVQKKPSPEEASEPEKPGKGRVPLVKEVSPGAVQMKKVPTQSEEEVFEEEAEEMEGEEEEEAWGWELVPAEDWEGEGVDGVLETPGMPGGKRGEAKSHKLPN